MSQAETPLSWAERFYVVPSYLPLKLAINPLALFVSARYLTAAIEHTTRKLSKMKLELKVVLLCVLVTLTGKFNFFIVDRVVPSHLKNIHGSINS